MVKIDHNRCNVCGLCIQICHEHCISIENNALNINRDFCSTCSQCIAICPKEALSWNDIIPKKFNKKLLPDPDQIDELLKERRTIRDFKSEKISKDLLQEVVNYAIYAPIHSYDYRMIVTDNKYVINEIDRAIFSYSSKMYRYLYKPKYFQKIVKLFTPGLEREYLKVKPKLEAALIRNRNFKTTPPAIAFIVSDKRVPLGTESAQYALYSINLYAHTKGLGCRNLVGNQMFLNRVKNVRQLLGLKKHEKIVGTMAIGYPSVKFTNKVEGKKVEIDWIN